MEKTPISLFIDDAAPRVHVYREHSPDGVSDNGTPLLSEIPNDFLFDFCDLAEKENLRGKFSIVPMAGCRGDIAHGFPGFPYSEIEEWLNAVKNRLGGRFSFTPELLTHHKAVNLADGSFYRQDEAEWSASQDRASLCAYVQKALTLLGLVGIRSIGVTSPWGFGKKTEPQYAAAVSDAVRRVCGETFSFYILHCRPGVENTVPWIAYKDGEQCCVSVPTTTGDLLWDLIDVPADRVNDELLSRFADRVLTEDGKHGAVIDAMQNGSVPVLLTHWQSLFSNGTRAGLRALGIAAQRINRTLGDRVEWTCAEQLARRFC